MKNLINKAVWHLDSMMWFYDSGLPELLQRKLPLVGYEARSSAARKVDVHVTVDSETGPVSVLYGDLPAPDDSGVFRIDDRRLVVVPVAETEDFETGRILCVGYDCMMWEEWAGHWEENPKYKGNESTERPNIFIKGNDHGDCGLKSKELE